MLLLAAVLLTQSAFQPAAGGAPEGWSRWSARAEIAPRAFVDQLVNRGEPGSLAINGNSNPAAHGGWHRAIDGIAAGRWYRFSASYRTEGVPFEHRQVLARLEWRTAGGKRAGQPDYVYQTRRDGEWRLVWIEVPAPEGAASVVLQLYLSNAPQGTVWWDDISFAEIAPPGPRNVKVATVNLRPAKTGGAEESVRQFLDLVDRAVPGGTDVVLLPEGITVVGTGKTYAEVAEPVPGPTTARLGEMAKKKNAWIAAGIYEREGGVVYNTAVLVNRQGAYVGKYRKVYLPREEVEGGITPGDFYPVFRTDFGTVGMMICYDVFFTDPARALALKGAEMILMPIWGGNETLAKARAIENMVFLIASGYDHPTYIMDPDGERIVQASERGAVALATINLGKRYLQPFLGDMRARRPKELRLDIPIPPPEH